MPQNTATADDESVDTSDDVNELEAYFDDPDADIEADDTADEAEEVEEVESESEDDDSLASDDESEDTEEDTQSVETVEESQSDESDETEAEEEDTASDEQETEESTSNKTKEELAQESFKRREAERKLREEREARERQDLEAYLDAAKDDEVELAKREREVNTYVLNKQRSEVLTEKLDVSMQKAVLDLGLKDMDEATRNYVGRRLDEFEATRVIRDAKGNILDVRGDVYQYLKEELGSIQEFRSSGAREQTKKKAKEKVAVIPKPTRTPKEKPVDEDMAAFDEEANSW